MFNEKEGRELPDAQYMGADLAQKIGLNAYHLWRGVEYLRALDKEGIVGRGKKIDCGDLSFSRSTDVAFAETLLRMIAGREGIGDDLAEGLPRAAERWGRAQEDFKSGILAFPYWGYAEHLNDPRCEIEWGYGSILAERDCNEHCFSYSLFYAPTAYLNRGKNPPLTAEKLVELFSSKMVPYAGDKRMLDFSMDNAYSDSMVKTVSWQKDYHGFYINALGFCDKRYPRWFEEDAFKAEPMFYTAVTGKNLTFLEGMQKGRRIWSLRNAIWTLQGRHRDSVHFAPYIYEKPFTGAGFPLAGWHYFMPGMEKGEWKYLDLNGRKLDRGKFEGFKTRFYEFQGWDPKTGWLKRSTLESQDLNRVADELENKGKLGEG
jgi:aldehyde:ferredoxin oxidoreductase